MRLRDKGRGGVEVLVYNGLGRTEKVPNPALFLDRDVAPHITGAQYISGGGITAQ